MIFRNFRPDIEYDRNTIARLRAKSLRRMGYAALEAAGGSAMALFSWNKTNYGWWTTAATVAGSAIAMVGTYQFCSSVIRYCRSIPTRERKRMQSTWVLTGGICMYLGSVYGLNAFLKDNSRLWMYFLGASVASYCVTVTSMTYYVETFSNGKKFRKFCQLMLGPALIAGAAFYLRGIQKHQEEWLFFFPLIASFVVGHYAAYKGGKNLESTEPISLLFKGMEFMTGGCLITISSAVLFLYIASHDCHPIWTFLSLHVFGGLIYIDLSLQFFQLYSGVPEHIFYCHYFMIAGPLVFSTACLIVKFTDSFFRLPLFFLMGGTGLAMVWLGVVTLYEQVHRPEFERYTQRTLGPTLIVYGTLVSVYMGYQMGWRLSLATAPFVPIGMYMTYRGFT